MTLDEAIQHCLDVAKQCDSYKVEIEYKCGEEHRQFAEWLMELKDVRAELNDNAVFIRELMDELKDAKRLLKISLDDIETALTEEKCKVCGLDYCGVDTICKWRYADEVKKFLNE